MLNVANVSLSFGKRTLFDEVSVQFVPGNCYGLIGANGAGKSTFIKILSGEIEPSSGEVIIQNGARMAVLKQDHFAYEEFEVMKTVIMGHKKLFQVMTEKDAIYANPEATEDDYMKAADLEAEFGELNGYNAESEAGELLCGLGIPTSKHNLLMSELEAGDKVRVLLAQALFGNPEILLLDEPTNHLDHATISWLENFLANYQNVVIVVSHDRHFLDSVCTHIADIDYSKITFYTGNYTFWYQSSQLALTQKRDQNKKAEDKKKELEDFIRRFSANASKSKQASSRKKLLEKLNIDEIKPSSRKYPHIWFTFEKELGNQILTVENLTLVQDGITHFKDLSFSCNKGDKIAFAGKNSLGITRLFQVLNGELEATSGEIRWGGTVLSSYLPNDNQAFFNSDLDLVQWLRQYTSNEDLTFIRGFLGKMLFSGEESLKKAKVISGGEKMRCMFSRMMLMQGNFLMLDQPTNHLDLESITALNDGLDGFKSNILFTSHDHQLVTTVANRIIEFTANGMIDSFLNYDEYLEDAEVIGKQEKLYKGLDFT